MTTSKIKNDRMKYNVPLQLLNLSNLVSILLKISIKTLVNLEVLMKI